MAVTKERLHRLVESLPDREIHVAERFLEFLNDAHAAVEEARADVAAGRVVSHEEARRRLLGT